MKTNHHGLVIPSGKQKTRVLSEETAMSYEEWASCGYYVCRGEKSEIRDILGIPQFTIEQVKKKKQYGRFYN